MALPCSTAFGALSPDRRDPYAAAIETLTLTQHASEDFGDLLFPRITRLNIHFALANKPAVLADVLGRCGPKLGMVYLTANDDDGYVWEDVGDGSDHFDWINTRYSRPEPQVLQLLAQRHGLTDLIVRKCIIDSDSLEHVRARVDAPFAHLKRLVAHVDENDAHAVVALLNAPALRELTLVIMPERCGPSVTHAVAQHHPQLAKLQLWFWPELWSPNNIDLFALHGMHASLTALSVRDACLNMSSVAEWRAWLLGLPRIARLYLGRCTAELPADAWLIAGECCPRLTHFELHLLSDLDALEHVRASTSSPLPLFPELQVLRLRPQKKPSDL